tara:strand:+ start:7041 stop:9590 length:2550 start_codon:yes stop_codon:yes gene_type:complete
MASIPAPTVIRVSFVPGSLSLIWQADKPAGFSYYLVTLLANGKVSKTFKSDLSTYSIQQAFDPTIVYTVYVSVYVNDASVSQSPTYSVITEPPTMAHITYNGPGNLLVKWHFLHQTGVASYIATLDQKGGTTRNEPSNTNEAFFKVTLDHDGPYTITVTATDKTGVVLGPPSIGYAPLINKPTMAHITNNGPSDLGVFWQKVDETGVAGYVATLDQKNGATWNEPSDTTDATFKVTLVEGDIYSITVRTTDKTGIILGPPSKSYAPLIAKPTMANVIYNGPNDLALKWEKVTETGIAGYVATLDQKGGTTWNVPSVTTQAHFKVTLEENATYTTSVRTTDKTGVVLGPPSSHYAPLLRKPTMAQVIYNIPAQNIGGLKVQWQRISSPEVTGYIATLNEKNGPTWNEPSDTTEVTFPLTLTPRGDYSVSVRAHDKTGIVLGPPSHGLALITEAPSMKLITFDEPTHLSVEWQKISLVTVTGYIASLDETNGPTYNQPSHTTEATFDVGLKSGPTYNITVRGHDTTGIVLGPASQIYNPIVEKPTATLFQNDTDNVSLEWNNVAGSEGTQISLKADATPTLTNVPTPAEKKTIPFDVTSDTVMTLRAYGQNSVVFGPQTTGLNPITETVALSSLNYDGTNMTVNWLDFQGPETIDSAHIIVPGQAPINAPAKGPKSFPLTPQEPPATIALRGTSGPILVGPLGTGLMPIYEAPPAVSMVWDQTDFIISWALIPNNVATDYVITLYKDNVADPTQHKPAPPLKIAQATIEANTSYQTQVQGINGLVTGPPSDKVSGPYRSTVTFNMDTQGRLHKETWTGLGTVAYGMDAAGNITSVTPTPVQAQSHIRQVKG